MKKTLFILSAMALLFAACNKEEIQQTHKSGEPFTLTISYPVTKTTIDSDGKVTWVEGEDNVVVHNGYTYQTVPVTNVSADGRSATITTTVDATAGRYPDYLFVIYPAEAFNTAARSGNMYYYDNVTTSNAQIAVGNTNTSSLSLINVCGGMSFSVDGSIDVDSYEIVDNNGAAIGYSALEIKDKNGTAAPEIHDGSYTVKDQTAVTGEVTPGSTAYAWFAFGQTFSDGITIYFKKDGEKKFYVTSSGSLSVSQGHIANFGDLTSKLQTYVAPSAVGTEIFARASGIDLTTGVAYNGTSGETANCYVISAGGNYVFPAVKGNGSAALSAGTTAIVVWESFGTSEAPTAKDLVSDIGYRKEDSDTYGYVYVTVPATFKQGNALVAVTDGANILWSWHLWLTTKDTSTGSTYDFSGKALMKYNLGAVDEPGTIGSYGLLYQWGRKDPFLGTGTLTGTTVAAIAEGGTARSTLAGPLASESETVSIPTKFITSSGDWLSASNTGLWSTSKTIYDPCPAGWRVPADSDNSLFTIASGDVTAWDTSSGTFSVKPGENTYTFPVPGYMYYSSASYDKPALRGKYWTCTNGTYGTSLYIYDSSGTATVSLGGQRKANGQSVRCVVDE